MFRTLGWRPFFLQQLSLDELDSCIPARIVEQHKSIISVACESSLLNIELQASMPEMVVGDWVLLDKDEHFIRLLERSTCFKRNAAGSRLERQLISANVDSAFIVCSLNEDFNLNRIERYLSLVNEAGAEAVVVLSKSDLSDPRFPRFRETAQGRGRPLGQPCREAQPGQSTGKILQTHIDRVAEIKRQINLIGILFHELCNTARGRSHQITTSYMIVILTGKVASFQKPIEIRR